MSRVLNLTEHKYFGPVPSMSLRVHLFAGNDTEIGYLILLIGLYHNIILCIGIAFEN